MAFHGGKRNRRDTRRGYTARAKLETLCSKQAKSCSTSGPGTRETASTCWFLRTVSPGLYRACSLSVQGQDETADYSRAYLRAVTASAGNINDARNFREH